MSTLVSLVLFELAFVLSVEGNLDRSTVSVCSVDGGQQGAVQRDLVAVAAFLLAGMTVNYILFFPCLFFYILKSY